MNHFTKNALLVILIAFPFSCSNQSTKESNKGNSNANVTETQTTIDFSQWTGSYFNYGGEGNGIRLEGKGDTLRAFDAADGAQLEVELMDGGMVLIDGAEAFVSNDTLRLVLNGSGGSHEVVYVREELNYVN
jgi:hypothetical protein